MDFVAIDFETANRSKSSICQVGIVRYRGGMLVETWSALVNPEDDFEDAYHSDLHGIQADHVVAAPLISIVGSHVFSVLLVGHHPVAVVRPPEHAEDLGIIVVRGL